VSPHPARRQGRRQRHGCRPPSWSRCEGEPSLHEALGWSSRRSRTTPPAQTAVAQHHSVRLHAAARATRRRGSEAGNPLVTSDASGHGARSARGTTDGYNYIEADVDKNTQAHTRAQTSRRTARNSRIIKGRAG
jgi:hypothetical protein